MRSMPLGGMVAGVVALVLLGGSALAATPAKAPKPRDVAAARAVIHAFSRFDRRPAPRGCDDRAAKAMVAQVQAGCAGTIPSSIAKAPKQQGVFLDSSSRAPSTSRSAPSSRSIMLRPSLTKRLDRVHFSNATFTRRIHDTAKAQQLLLAIKPS